MNVWARRALVVFGVLLLVFGGILRGPFLVIALFGAGAMFLVAGRQPPEAIPSASLLEVNGQTWTRDTAGRPNRWNPEHQTWEVVDPAPPEVIRAWDRREPVSARSPAGRVVPIVGIAIIVVLGLSAWAFVDPYANIPIVSQIVCSLKGASWQDGSTVLNVPAGCYGRSDDGEGG